MMKAGPPGNAFPPPKLFSKKHGYLASPMNCLAKSMPNWTHGFWLAPASISARVVVLLVNAANLNKLKHLP